MVRRSGGGYRRGSRCVLVLGCFVVAGEGSTGMVCCNSVVEVCLGGWVVVVGSGDWVVVRSFS